MIFTGQCTLSKFSEPLGCLSYLVFQHVRKFSFISVLMLAAMGVKREGCGDWRDRDGGDFIFWGDCCLHASANVQNGTARSLADSLLLLVN